MKDRNGKVREMNGKEGKVMKEKGKEEYVDEYRSVGDRERRRRTDLLAPGTNKTYNILPLVAWKRVASV